MLGQCSSPSGKCDGYLGRRARQVQTLVMQRDNRISASVLVTSQLGRLVRSRRIRARGSDLSASRFLLGGRGLSRRCVLHCHVWTRSGISAPLRRLKRSPKPKSAGYGGKLSFYRLTILFSDHDELYPAGGVQRDLCNRHCSSVSGIRHESRSTTIDGFLPPAVRSLRTRVESYEWKDSQLRIGLARVRRYVEIEPYHWFSRIGPVVRVRVHRLTADKIRRNAKYDWYRDRSCQAPRGRVYGLCGLWCV